jgi:hypothetical protein
MMSKFNQGGKPSRPNIVTSRKKLKAERRLAQAYGEQKQKAVRVALERAEELERAIKSPDDPNAIGALIREAARPEHQRNEAAMASFRRRLQNGESLTEVQADLTEVIVAERTEDTSDLLGVEAAYPVTTDWAADEENWYTPETGWKCAIHRLKNSSREALNCPHKHKTPETARGCAMREAMGRNKHSDWSDSVWSVDARYPWTDGRVSALIDELRAE